MHARVGERLGDGWKNQDAPVVVMKGTVLGGGEARMFRVCRDLFGVSRCGMMDGLLSWGLSGRGGMVF